VKQDISNEKIKIFMGCLGDQHRTKSNRIINLWNFSVKEKRWKNERNQISLMITSYKNNIINRIWKDESNDS